jgi:Ca-activated chloride channel family protein
VHNIVNIDAPQGDMELTVGGTDYYSLKCIVKKTGQPDIVYVQDFNTVHRYLVGSYDLEILTLPRITVNKVNIDPYKPSKIEVPQPGKLELTYGRDVIGSLYVMRNNKQEWVIDIIGGGTIRRELFTLQPGNYKVVYRAKDSHNTIETKQEDYKIQSGGFTNLNLE